MLVYCKWWEPLKASGEREDTKSLVGEERCTPRVEGEEDFHGWSCGRAGHHTLRWKKSRQAEHKDCAKESEKEEEDMGRERQEGIKHWVLTFGFDAFDKEQKNDAAFAVCLLLIGDEVWAGKTRKNRNDPGWGHGRWKWRPSNGNWLGWTCAKS